jgi:hypothetical protein
MAKQAYNLEALGLEGEVKGDVKTALTFGNVDQAQLEYFKKVNKEALSQPLPPPPPPTAVESLEPTDDEVIQQQKAPIDADKGVVQNVYESIGNILWGSPQMRGHIK